MANIYVAARNMARAEEVIGALKDAGHTIADDWTAHYREDNDAARAMCEVKAIKAADVLVYLWSPRGEGSCYEAGMAMALGKPIIAVAPAHESFFFQLPNVHCVADDAAIIAAIAALGF